VPCQLPLSDQQTVARRAELLPCEADTALLKAVYANGEPVAAVARLRAEKPGRTARRLASLTRRLLSREFEFVLRHRESLPGHRRQIATICFVQGRSMRGAARELGISFYSVRRHCEAIRAMIDGQRESRGGAA
jgi:DNA-directed RNA polymerase specialized sigma24 family protein